MRICRLATGAATRTPSRTTAFSSSLLGGRLGFMTLSSSSLNRLERPGFCSKWLNITDRAVAVVSAPATINTNASLESRSIVFSSGGRELRKIPWNTVLDFSRMRSSSSAEALCSAFQIFRACASIESLHSKNCPKAGFSFVTIERGRLCMTFIIRGKCLANGAPSNKPVIRLFQCGASSGSSVQL